jgi:hypothetical protein
MFGKEGSETENCSLLYFVVGSSHAKFVFLDSHKGGQEEEKQEVSRV